MNPFLVKDLKARGLWNQEMIDALKYFDGELKTSTRPRRPEGPYLTAFDIDYKWVIEAAARRQKWIDQAQSVNLWLKTPDLKTLSHMYRARLAAGSQDHVLPPQPRRLQHREGHRRVKKEVRGAAGETKAETARGTQSDAYVVPALGPDLRRRRSGCLVDEVNAAVAMSGLDLP
jgi:ribonucleoside-diphosphate reductase alpha chain